MIYFYAFTSYQSTTRSISRAFHSIEDMAANVIQDGFIPTYWINDCNVRFYCEDDGITEISRSDIMAIMARM